MGIGKECVVERVREATVVARLSERPAQTQTNEGK